PAGFVTETTSSRIPCLPAREWPASAIRFTRRSRRARAEIPDLELDFAAMVPLVDRRVKDDGAPGARAEYLPSFGELPADRLHHHAATLQAKLQMIFVFADWARLAYDLKIARQEEGLGVADAVGLEPLDFLYDAEIECTQHDLGVDRENSLELLV